jgi:hypothetical protein
MARFNNMDLFSIAATRKWHLLAIVLTASVLAFVFSGETFIKPRYKSTAIVYPVNIIPYSMESPTEQLLQLFHSADVRKMMVARFNLAQHYGINEKGSAALTRLYNAYEENVLVRKTEFESIKVDIYDEDPDTACAMVNSIIDCVNIKARTLQREKTTEVVKILGDQLEVKQRQIDSLERISSELRVRYGLLDFNAQTKEATKAYLKLVGSSASPGQLRQVDSLMRNLEQKGGELISVSDQLQALRDSYNTIKGDYDRAVSDMTKELTYSNVVTKPFPADSKSYPVRSLIVLICAFSSLLLGILLFVALERIRESKSNGEPEHTS